MQNFVFHNPTKILFGTDKLSLIGEETRVFGSKALLVYGKQSLKNQGTYDKILASLDEAGLNVVELDGVEPNPNVTKAREGIELAKSEDIDVIVGAGGGSVIDTAKAISAGAMVNHDVWKFFTGKKSVQSCLPLTTVLTIPGSGSEMNNSMVLTNDEKKLKFGFGHRLLFPKVSILDPALTFSINPAYTAYGAVDALCHILEFYMTHQEEGAQLNRRLMEGIMKTVMRSCSQCLEKPSDYTSRANLLWASTLSLNGLIASGLGKVGFPMHLLEHSISGLYGTPHGAGLSALLPNWIRYYIKVRPDRLEELGKGIFCETINDSVPAAEAGHLFLLHLTRWMEEVGLPKSLSEIGLQQIDYAVILEHTKPLAKTWRLQQYTPDLLEEILNN